MDTTTRTLTPMSAIDRLFVVRTGYRLVESRMEPVTVSPKYQVVIPKDVRERLRLRPGQRMRVLAYDDRIELIPVRPMTSMRGAFPGLDTAVPREPDRL